MRIFVTGAGGLVGSTVAEVAHAAGHTVWGVDSDERGKLFGSAGSVAWRIGELSARGIDVVLGDFRNFLELVATADLVVHCASQPSHDYSRSHVLYDSALNYMGTVELLEAVRERAPEAVFAFLSTNKVYGDRVNSLPYEVRKERLVPLLGSGAGIDENYPIDESMHTPFGVSKTAADLMVQEYRYCFGLQTVSFRCGCLTGKGGSAVELQGFLGYLVKCAVEGKPYTIYGHGGYQVRDNIDATDVARAILLYAENPQRGLYNLGGGPTNSVSIREVIAYLRDAHGCEFETSDGPERVGDHKHWVTDTYRFETDYPDWLPLKSVWQVLDEMVGQVRKAA